MWASFLVGLFSSEKIQNVAIDGLRKLGGLDDMTPREKSEYVLQYIAATKHQSPTRRLLAVLITALFALLILCWLVSALLGYYLNYTEALEFAGAVRMLLENVVLTPFNLILSFYFATQIMAKVGK